MGVLKYVYVLLFSAGEITEEANINIILTAITTADILLSHIIIFLKPLPVFAFISYLS